MVIYSINRLTLKMLFLSIFEESGMRGDFFKLGLDGDAFSVGERGLLLGPVSILGGLPVGEVVFFFLPFQGGD